MRLTRRLPERYVSRLTARRISSCASGRRARHAMYNWHGQAISQARQGLCDSSRGCR